MATPTTKELVGAISDLRAPFADVGRARGGGSLGKSAGQKAHHRRGESVLARQSASRRMLLAIRCVQRGKCDSATRLCMDERVKLKDVLAAWCGSVMQVPGGLPPESQVLGVGGPPDLGGSLASNRHHMPMKDGRPTLTVTWPADEVKITKYVNGRDVAALEEQQGRKKRRAERDRLKTEVEKEKHWADLRKHREDAIAKKQMFDSLSSGERRRLQKLEQHRMKEELNEAKRCAKDETKLTKRQKVRQPKSNQEVGLGCVPEPHVSFSSDDDEVPNEFAYLLMSDEEDEEEDIASARGTATASNSTGAPSAAFICASSTSSFPLPSPRQVVLNKGKRVEPKK